MKRPKFDALLTETITVTRAANPGGYVRGRWRPAEGDITLTFRASVQPAAGEILQNNPEQERTTEQVNIWLAEELFTAVTSPLFRPDVVGYDGKNYEVIVVERWHGFMPHFKITAERLEPEGNT